ncbi:hypothetical protein KL930_000925 [Ogataea haglerorum]|uniref:PH-like domain-containing protein n=1 Tax=Ogataea haglerorum TaxID=1937702 RepID=A0AAN6D9U0_9ASCO|nr:hypothetical protein KL915_000926 [Ogataea haglerorum]KAG7711708.1 hypothetical protein KL914_000350 [Ogataea haglerorum]KAG7730619.1 hypothetical protein KL933_000414 [Ogataea haglerorum]KAG7761243.1 hypothetical protein KL947_000191 [Ogataea haglerorum]KAG7769129.1 hypothetical protein KL946_000412 [Ogataea haglerorum]
MNSPTDAGQVLGEIKLTESHYVSELGSLMILVNAFDVRFNNYFDDMVDDAIEEQISYRQKMNARLAKVVRKLIVMHRELAQILQTDELAVLAAQFATWCTDAIKLYKQYISLYRLQENQTVSEVELRRQPLLRLAYLHQTIRAVKSILSLQMDRLQGGAVFSDLEVATHRLEQTMEEAHRMEYLQRKKLDKHVNFSSVRSMTDFSMICSSFSMNSVVETYRTEMYYTNEKLDTSLIFKTLELMFLRNQTIALVSLEKGERTLVFPPLRANELQYDRQVEDEIYVFKHTLDTGICVYLKLDSPMHSRLARFWNRPAKLGKTRSVGMGIQLQDSMSSEVSEGQENHRVSEVKAYRIQQPQVAKIQPAREATRLPLQPVSSSKLNSFDPQRFAQNYQHGIDGSYLKKKRQTVFGMLSTIIRKKMTVAESTDSIADEIYRKSKHMFLQRVEWCRWADNQWSQPLNVDLLLLQSDSENYLMGTNIESELRTEFLIKLNDSTIVRRASEMDIHITSCDLQSAVTLFWIKTAGVDEANELFQSVLTRSRSLSNSNSYSSNLSTTTYNSSIKTFVTSTSIASTTKK